MPKPQRLCILIRKDGTQCRAVALSRKRFCKFHARDRQRLDIKVRSSKARLRALKLPVPGDKKAMRMILNTLNRALDLRTIDSREARLVHYALQLNQGLASSLTPLTGGRLVRLK